eukprot:3738002-Rhodomonas_salina.3
MAHIKSAKTWVVLGHKSTAWQKCSCGILNNRPIEASSHASTLLCPCNPSVHVSIPCPTLTPTDAHDAANRRLSSCVLSRALLRVWQVDTALTIKNPDTCDICWGAEGVKSQIPVFWIEGRSQIPHLCLRSLSSGSHLCLRPFSSPSF